MQEGLQGNRGCPTVTSHLFNSFIKLQPEGRKRRGDKSQSSSEQLPWSFWVWGQMYPLVPQSQGGGAQVQDGLTLRQCSWALKCGFSHGYKKWQRWELPAAFPYFAINIPHGFRNATISPKCFAEVKHRQPNVGKSLDEKHISLKPSFFSLLP